MGKNSINQRKFGRIGILGVLFIICLFITVPSTAFAQTTMPVIFHAWNTYQAFQDGTFENGAVLKNRASHPVITLANKTHHGAWISPEFRSRTAFMQLVPSWQSQIEPGAWIDVKLSVKMHGKWSGWYSFGQWTFGNGSVPQSSVPSQNDHFGSVSIDTYSAKSATDSATAYKLRVELFANGDAKPSVRELAAVVSDPGPVENITSKTQIKQTIELPVPPLSEYAHNGEYPAFDGGGEAWCSPTSTAMVVSYWGTGPTQSDLQTLPADPIFEANHRADAIVDYAAAHVYDANYQGAGNWPFNTAYAAQYGLDSSVRQFSSLVNAEDWIKKKVPSIVSIKWDNTDNDPSNNLTGASIEKTAGHLMVIRGFTKNGDVIVNDPASPNDSQVRHIYKRDQFEHDWLTASHGIVYLIKPYTYYQTK